MPGPFRKHVRRYVDLTDKEKDKMRELHDKHEIAKNNIAIRFNCTFDTVTRVLKEKKVSTSSIK